MSLIYHLTTEKNFLSQIASEEYTPPNFEVEGFIHFSQAHQVSDVVEKYYKDEQGLLLLVVETSFLTSPLKYEPPINPGRPPSEKATEYDGDLFPHLYGKLNKTSIVDILPMRRDENGNFIKIW